MSHVLLQTRQLTDAGVFQTFDSETAWNQKNKSKHPSIRSGADVDKDYASSFHVKVRDFIFCLSLISSFTLGGGGDISAAKVCFWMYSKVTCFIAY